MDARVIRHLERQEKMLEQLQNVVLKHGDALRSGLVPNQSASTLKANLDASLPKRMMPGNVGELSYVFWPFWFTATPGVDLSATGIQNQRGSIVVTQEAAFVCMGFVKNVYELTAGEYHYVNPMDFSQSGQANGLSATITDSSSKRTFFNQPMELDLIGNPQFMSMLCPPTLFLPLSVVDVEFFNDDPTRVYRPFFTFFGYRVRLDQPYSSTTHE
jgi:hypothetical protein